MPTFAARRPAGSGRPNRRDKLLDQFEILGPGGPFHPTGNIHPVRANRPDRLGHISRIQSAADDNFHVRVISDNRLRNRPVKGFARASELALLLGIEQHRVGEESPDLEGFVATDNRDGLGKTNLAFDKAMAKGWSLLPV